LNRLVYEAVEERAFGPSACSETIELCRQTRPACSADSAFDVNYQPYPEAVVAGNRHAAGVVALLDSLFDHTNLPNDRTSPDLGDYPFREDSFYFARKSLCKGGMGCDGRGLKDHSEQRWQKN
jgi:hypothetical protein